MTEILDTHGRLETLFTAAGGDTGTGSAPSWFSQAAQDGLDVIRAYFRRRLTQWSSKRHVFGGN